MLDRHLSDHSVVVNAVMGDEKVKSLWLEADDLLYKTINSGHCVYIAGNGGSAADAQHFAAEIVGRFIAERKGYPALALTTDTSILTAIGNDYGFDKIFSRQLDALAGDGDCFVAISTSGNSQNIINTLNLAKNKGIKTILLSGNTGGKARDLADIAIVVPSNNTAYIQELHQIFYHSWCASFDKRIVS
ncbi:SIS domain-containing protein [Candidatus Woesebacteria bacterium]|nr:SIS domain-containing protein [Candidatus Woesebacteria bacterium]